MADTEEGKPLSLEEQTAEKLRLQQVQKDADLEVAKELFGGALSPMITLYSITTFPCPLQLQGQRAPSTPCSLAHWKTFRSLRKH